jgi:aryl-alcohol dehydrogenase-like predicted oxidoreductase
LGSSGLRVSELFLGAMTFGDQGGVGAPLDDCRRILDAYADAGGNVIDTASNYRGGASEEIVGDLLVGRRDRFVLSTKYTVTRDSADPNAAGNHRKNLVLTLEQSLRRLRTDYIDLYWVHIWDRATPIEATMRALDDAVRSGKVLHVGLSDTPAWVVARGVTLAEWRGWTPVVALQVPYSLLQRDIERELLPMAESLGLTVAAWSPLAGGALSGKYTNGAGADGRLSPDSLSERDREVAMAVHAVADEIGATPSQVAIAWTRAKSSAIQPIVGARRVGQLLDNLGALDIQLSPEHLTRLEQQTAFRRGFPLDFIDDTCGWVFGAAYVTTPRAAPEVADRQRRN